MTSLFDNQTTGSANKITANSCTRIAPTLKNPRGYSSFDMQHVLNYINNQIIYYYIIGTIPATELTHFHQFMNQQKVSLNLIRWDGMSNNEDKPPENIIASHNHKNSDLECSISLPGAVNIKISSLYIIQLKYDSTMIQYSN